MRIRNAKLIPIERDMTIFVEIGVQKAKEHRPEASELIETRKYGRSLVCRLLFLDSSEEV